MSLAEGWLNKYGWILFSPVKEGNSDTCYSLDEYWGNYAKWNQLISTGQIVCDSFYIRVLECEFSYGAFSREKWKIQKWLIETESRIVIMRGMVRCRLMNLELQFCKMKKYGDWLHKNVNMLNTTEYLKWFGW
jgi:hypothetical protein